MEIPIRRNITTLNKDEIENMKLAFKKRKLAKKILIEIFYNFMFLCILFLVAYTNKDSNSYDYQNQIKLLFQNYNEVIMRKNKMYNYYI